MGTNGEAIYGTRPFVVFGEGPPDVKGSGNFNENSARPYTAEDIRFTTKGDTLYAFALGLPAGGRLTINSLGNATGHYPRQIGRIEPVGDVGKPLPFTRGEQALVVTLPPERAGGIVSALRITGV
jgi:alpha-L-fucosidase